MAEDDDDDDEDNGELPSVDHVPHNEEAMIKRVRETRLGDATKKRFLIPVLVLGGKSVSETSLGKGRKKAKFMHSTKNHGPYQPFGD